MTTAGVAQGMLAAALEAWDAGLAPIPVRMDFTKRPALEKWNGRTHERFARAEVERLFAEPRALGIVCGEPSGGLELLEVEGAAVEEGMWQRLFDSWPAELRERVCAGYLEFSPSGGVHILYRVEGEVAGNTKLARRPRPDIAKAACDTLIETRGAGGFVVVAPSPGEAHESGQPWELHSGGFGSIATITAAERETLIAAARVFDEMPPEPERQARAPATRTGKGTRPGEDFDARHVCGEVLERNGWTVVRRRGDEVMWCRPGKSAREGHSGIEHLDEPNRFVNWSSSVDLECERGYSPFALVAALEHGGDFAAAARELGKQGYGEQRKEPPEGGSKGRPTPVVSDRISLRVTDRQDEIVTKAFEPEQGSPNGRHPKPVPPLEFPLAVFPPALQEFVRQTCASVCCTPEMVAPMMLGAASALIGKSRALGVKADWRELPRLWVLVVAESGWGKSPALDRAIAPVEAVQQDLERLWGPEHEAWEELEPKEQKKAAEPILPQVLASDVTWESLRNVLANHPRGTLIERDELSGWSKSFGQYKAKGGDDRQKWLEAWSGKTIRVNRASLPQPLVIRDPFISIVGGTQPSSLPDFVRATVDDGMLYRFLPAAPEPVAERTVRGPAVDPAVTQAWVDCGKVLYSLGETTGLYMTPEALEYLQDEIDALWAGERKAPAEVRGFWSKAPAHLQRLAVVVTELWHAAEGEPESVTLERAQGAAAAMRFFLDHARVLFADRQLGAGPEYEHATPGAEAKLVTWLRERGGQATKREAIRGPLRRMSPKEVEITLSAVVIRGELSVRNEARDRVLLELL